MRFNGDEWTTVMVEAFAHYLAHMKKTGDWANRWPDSKALGEMMMAHWPRTKEPDWMEVPPEVQRRVDEILAEDRFGVAFATVLPESGPGTDFEPDYGF